MELILWRHADAEYAASSDLARRLTGKGQKQARAMAQWLHEQLAGRTVRLIASGAVRAQETLTAFSPNFTIDPRLNCGASVEDYLEACGWSPAAEELVILVGHQPEIGEVANYLLYGRATECEFKKGAVCWLQSTDASKDSLCRLKVLMTPEML